MLRSQMLKEQLSLRREDRQQGRGLHKTQWGLWRHHKLLHTDFSSWSAVAGGEVVGKDLHKDPVPGELGAAQNANKKNRTRWIRSDFS